MKQLRNLLIILPILIATACLNVSINNVWKVPNTKLEIVVEKKKSPTGNEVERIMKLRDSYLDKTEIKLAKGMDVYTRLNVYQIGENQYVIRDFYEVYQLNTEEKALTKTSASILSATFENTEYPKFIGAFDNNNSGSWRYIPASERKEIQIGK